MNDGTETLGVGDGPGEEGDSSDGDHHCLEVEEEANLAGMQADQRQRDEREEEEAEEVPRRNAGALGQMVGDPGVTWEHALQHQSHTLTTNVCLHTVPIQAIALRLKPAKSHPNTKTAPSQNRERDVVHCTDTSGHNHQKRHRKVTHNDRSPSLDHVRPADTAVLAIINVLRLRPSEIQKEAKLTQPHVRRSGGTGRRSALRSIALPRDSPGRRSEPLMAAALMARLMSVMVSVECWRGRRARLVCWKLSDGYRGGRKGRVK